YAPGTDEGRRLLAHELAHVVQQSQQPQLAAHPTIMRAVSPLPSSEELQKEIAALQWRLALLKERYPNVSNPEIVEVEETLESKQTLQGRINAAESELRQNESEYKTLSMIFSPEKATAIARTYAKEVTPEIAEHCMGAFYTGLGAFYTPKEASTIR